MKAGEIFRFELAYQVRRISTWLYFAGLTFIAFVQTVGNFLPDARSGGFLLSAPLVVAEVTAIGCLVWMLVAAYIAGDAAARDIKTGMHPLIYTAPLSKADYLGGRFLAAFVVNALILLALPVGILLGMHAPEVEAEIRGPFRPAAYLTAYAFIALPNAFVATAIQFSFAALSRRATAGYLVGLLLLIVTGLGVFLAEGMGLWASAKLSDPSGMVFLSELSRAWTSMQKNTLLIGLEGSLLANRLLWLGIALATLAFAHFRFRFAHPTGSTWWNRITRRREVHDLMPPDIGIAMNTPISVPQVKQTFDFGTYTRQTLHIGWASFLTIAKSWSGLLFFVIIAMLAVLTVGGATGFMGVPLLPRTDQILADLLRFQAQIAPWIVIPLLIVFWAGGLVWREREAGLSEITDAAPMPEWVPFLGKFLGLGLVLIVCMALLMMAGVLVQIGMGYFELEIGLYLQILFGLHLASYLLLALFALGMHVVVNQKHIGQLAILFILFWIVFAIGNGIAHNLIIPGAAPLWSYTDMSGFGASLGPWLWFKLYWAAWALLFAVVTRLLWVRGKESHWRARLHIARRRVTRPTAWTAAVMVGLILALGTFIFYNTNVLNEFHTAPDRMEQRAEYERRYRQYKRTLHTQLAGINLHVEIYPKRRVADIRGTYRLVNNNETPIDSIHLAMAVAPEEIGFDRPAQNVLIDEDLGHRIYALTEPLLPGDSLRLSFEMQIAPNGFQNHGADASVVANGTFFWNYDWLPTIGYQPRRELSNAGERQAHGLAPRPAIPPLYDRQARQESIRNGKITFEAVVGTDEDQIAIAPGALRRTWTDDGRRYFHYAPSAPISNEYAFFSANYTMHEDRWEAPSATSEQVVTIQIFHHSGHGGILDRMLHSVRASLAYYTEQFGPYPYSHIRLVEHPGHGRGMHAEPTTISSEEGFYLLNPVDGPRGLDLPFFVVAHEVAHQWWGAQLAPARVEGAGLLIEGLASYSAYLVVKEAYGQAHLQRLLERLRRAYETPRTRAAPPLLRANNAFMNYRKGPFAMYALSQYMGEERVNGALQRMLKEHHAGRPSLLTSLDLYRELQAVTPDSLQYLLHDLFEANVFWDLETQHATAEPTEAGTWRVTLNVRARKMMVDSTSVETPVPLDDWVELGIFAPSEEGDVFGKPLYMQMHRIRATEQTITVTVPHKPAQAGIDPYHRLIDLRTGDNIAPVTIKP